jgi:hypothetical protein
MRGPGSACRAHLVWVAIGGPDQTQPRETSFCANAGNPGAGKETFRRPVPWETCRSGYPCQNNKSGEANFPYYGGNENPQSRQARAAGRCRGGRTVQRIRQTRYQRPISRHDFESRTKISKSEAGPQTRFAAVKANLVGQPISGATNWSWSCRPEPVATGNGRSAVGCGQTRRPCEIHHSSGTDRGDLWPAL